MLQAPTLTHVALTGSTLSSSTECESTRVTPHPVRWLGNALLLRIREKLRSQHGKTLIICASPWQESLPVDYASWLFFLRRAVVLRKVGESTLFLVTEAVFSCICIKFCINFQTNFHQIFPKLTKNHYPVYGVCRMIRYKAAEVIAFVCLPPRGPKPSSLVCHNLGLN